jgi:carboxylesterase
VPVLPGAEEFSHEGGDVGVLLCHGFTGSPQSLRPWAQELAHAGHTVLLPRLPGHGTTWQEMNRTGWQDWYATVDRAFRRLQDSCRVVVVGGLSMGGALALRLAEEHGAAVAGLILVNPAVKAEDPRLVLLPVIRHIVPSLPGIGSDIKRAGSTELAYDRTPLNALHSMLQMTRRIVADLPKVTQPLLLFRSTEDHVVPASSSALILERVGSTQVTEILCADSYHVATLDHDAPLIHRESLAFVSRLASAVDEAV